MINQITQKAVIFVWLENQVSPSSSKSKVLTSSPLPSDTTALYEPASFFVTWGGEKIIYCVKVKHIQYIHHLVCDICENQIFD